VRATKLCRCACHASSQLASGSYRPAASSGFPRHPRPKYGLPHAQHGGPNDRYLPGEQLPTANARSGRDRTMLVSLVAAPRSDVMDGKAGRMALADTTPTQPGEHGQQRAAQ